MSTEDDDDDGDDDAEKGARNQRKTVMNAQPTQHVSRLRVEEGKKMC